MLLVISTVCLLYFCLIQVQDKIRKQNFLFWKMNQISNCMSSEIPTVITCLRIVSRSQYDLKKTTLCVLKSTGSVPILLCVLHFKRMGNGVGEA